MQVSYSKVFDFFIKVINEDVDTLNKIVNQSGSIGLKGGKLIFSIKGLLSFLDEKGNENFSEFKKMLYSSYLNAELFEYGAKIEIYYSTSKVDTSLYCLSIFDSPTKSGAPIN